ncbi:hypothetical protein QUA27_02960 [Microcoleus sp. Pol14C6]|uniref:hypothetical protein n=1 Tax=unclassified Microcoleus TaxID=2642155 RepID=UPI002FCFA0AA
MTLVRGCKRAPQVKTYLKTNLIKGEYPNSSISLSFNVKRKMALPQQVSIAYVGFLTINNAQLATPFRATSLWEAEHRTG